MAQGERLQHLVDKLLYDMSADYDSGKINFRYFIGSTQVCGPFFMAAYPLSKYMFKNIRDAVCKRRLHPEAPRKDNKIAPKTSSVIEFLRTYIDKHGQGIPNKEEVHFPRGMSRSFVYVEYLSSFTAEEISHGDHAALPTWYQVLNTHYPHLKFPNYSSFSQCNICNKLKSNIEKSEGRQREEYKKIRQIHLEQAALERRKYRKHWDKAKSGNPDKYMCMIIDGMTQNTTTLPHYKRKPKWLAQNQYACHVQGVMVAGRRATMEFAYHNVKKDANMNITSLHQAILREQQLRDEEGRPHPDVLYLQMDNVNTNKSKLLFAYLSWLVDKNIFKKVKVNFLLVGHTHENIDQLFSRFSISLRAEDCLTLDELMRCASRCLKKQPIVKEVSCSFDWKEWFRGCTDDLNDLSYNHAFRISPKEEKVVVESRQYGENASGIWESSQIQVLKSHPGTSEPQIQSLEPLSDMDMTSLIYLQTQIEKNTEVCFFTEDLKNYWDSQVQFQREVTSGDLNISTISIPFVMPHPCTYRPPPTLTRESALEAANPQLLAQVMPVARHIYTGPRQKQRAETLNLASDDIYYIKSIDDFNVECVSRQLAITWAPHLGEKYAFTVDIGPRSKPKYSPPLHLRLCKEVLLEQNAIKWQWVAPNKFTKPNERYISKHQAHANNAWFMAPQATEINHFDSDEILIAWEVPNRQEKLAQIPPKQYDQLVRWLQAREVRIAEEAANNDPQLLLVNNASNSSEPLGLLTN